MDVMQFLLLRGHSRLVPQGGISEFPDAILNAKRLDLYNLYREVRPTPPPPPLPLFLSPSIPRKSTHDPLSSGRFKGRLSRREWHQLEGPGVFQDAEPYDDEQNDRMFFICTPHVLCFSIKSSVLPIGQA